MQHTVPQFIEKEARIVGPLTFKQFIYIGTAGGFCLFLYFFVSLSVFIVVTTFLLGGALALAFLRIERTTLPVFIKNFFVFLFKPKVYLWKKKITPYVIYKEKKMVAKTEETGEKSALKIAEKSQLRQLFTRLETKHNK